MMRGSIEKRLWAPLLLLTIALAFVFACMPVPPAQAAQDQSQDTVKAGFIIVDDYNYLDVNGDWRGYDVEMLLKIAQYANFHVELVPFDSPSDALEALKNGKVDTITDFMHSTQRDAEFLFSDRPITLSEQKVYTANDNDKLGYGPVSQLDGLTVGCLAGRLAAMRSHNTAISAVSPYS